MFERLLCPIETTESNALFGPEQRYLIARLGIAAAVRLDLNVFTFDLLFVA
jgi:hypothetical protein